MIIRGFHADLFRRLLTEVKAGRHAYLGTVVDAEEEQGASLLWDQAGHVIASSLSASLPFHKDTGLYSATVQGKSVKWLVESYFPQPTLLVFGSGHIAESLVTMGKMLFYEVVVIDDRPEYTTAERFPFADRLFCGPFKEILPKIPSHSGCFAVLATRGHQTDAICLSFMLEKSLSYIGLVGSKRKIQSIYSLLHNEGKEIKETSPIFAPAGIDIHSETPQEIALSILTEIQLLRFGGTGELLSKLPSQRKVHSQDHKRMRQELQIIQMMKQASMAGEVFATITVIESFGHVPRGVGSKMIVWEDGRTYQTIGGGRREHELVAQALECIREKKAIRREVDFHGEYDSFQPVCGGRYTVFVQPCFPNPSSVEVKQ